MKKTILRILCILLLAPALAGCNDEDDIDAIFTKKKWKVVYLAKTSDWNNANDYVIQQAYDTHKEDADAYTVYFGEKNVVIRGLTAVWQGTWEVDAKKRTMKINISDKNNPGKTEPEKEFLQRVSEARHYKGDEIILKLFMPDKSSYVQFTPSK